MPVRWILTVFALGVVAEVVWLAVRAVAKYRGKRIVTCPENQHPAGVRVDTGHAAWTAGVRQEADLRLSECSRWPEKAGCGQDCLKQVREHPEDCLIRNILTKWYLGKVCRSCGAKVDIGPELSAQPGIWLADGSVVAWEDIPAETLTDVLAGAEPLCFACYMAARMVHDHPELVTVRPGKQSPRS